MSEMDLLLRFLQYTTGFSAICWDESEKMLEEIEKKHCFSRQSQPFLTARGLLSIFEQMKPGNLYEVEDPLGIHFFCFRFQERTVIAGPFVTVEWSEDGCAEKRRLIEAGLQASHLLPYKLYYCSYSVLNQNLAIRVVSGAVASLLPGVSPYTYQRFSGTLGYNLAELYAGEQFDFDSAVLQFNLEKQFYKAVSEGRTEAVLEVWGRMRRIPIAEQLLPFDLKQMLANVTGLRHTLRIVAEQSGVHAAVVFSISLSYAQRTFSVQNRTELERIIPAMIREFSDAVKSAQSSRYSPAIKDVVSYLNLHISQKIDMKQLSALAGCTSSLLRQRFKNETGQTIPQYLVQKRCWIAAELLRQTDLPVQKISTHVGYLDNNYFVKVFRKCIGDTPTDYRNKFRPS